MKLFFILIVYSRNVAVIILQSLYNIIIIIIKLLIYVAIIFVIIVFSSCRDINFDNNKQQNLNVITIAAIVTIDHTMIDMTSTLSVSTYYYFITSKMSIL